MKFAGKLSAGMSGFTKAVKNTAGNCKVDGKIEEQEKRIRELTKEIGALVVLRLEAGGEMSPEIMERFTAIQEAKEIIGTLESERIITKTVCPKCGAKTSVEMNYCGVCGSSMKED